MNFPRTSLDQWRVLHAVVEHGGYAQAAAALHRSQSSVSYAVGRLQEQLGIALLEPAGRRMRITGAGQALMRDAVPLIDSLLKLESRAQSLRQGWEAEVRLAADSVYPVDALLCGLADFSAQCPGTRVQLHEVVMSGADDALISGQVDIAITHRVPQGFLGDWLLEVEFVAVAAPSHPLHALGRPATPDDLAQHLLVVMRDSGNRQPPTARRRVARRLPALDGQQPGHLDLRRRGRSRLRLATPPPDRRQAGRRQPQTAVSGGRASSAGGAPPGFRQPGRRRTGGTNDGGEPPSERPKLDSALRGCDSPPRRPG